MSKSCKLLSSLINPTGSAAISEQNEIIIHKQHGVGRLQSLKRAKIWGQTAKNFVRVFFKRDQLTMIVRRDELEQHSRPMITESEARKVLTHISNGKPRVDKQWKSRARKNEKALESCDPFKLADVYKSLSLLDAKGEKLRAADRNAQRTAFDLLTEELAASLGKSRQTIAARLEG